MRERRDHLEPLLIRRRDLRLQIDGVRLVFALASLTRNSEC